jgi:hypothetical protein
VKSRDPQGDRRRAADDGFDPVAEGARFRLSAEVADQVWWVVERECRDADGEVDRDRAVRRFREVAARAAARHGRLHTAPGKVTRVGAETWGRDPGADVFRRGVPGRVSRVDAEAQRWAWRTRTPRAVIEPSELPHQREVEALLAAPDHGDDEDADAWAPLDEAAATPAPRPRLRVMRGGAALPEGVADELAPTLGAAARRARIHTGPHAEALAAAHAAHAVTYGEDVYFGRGAYQPDTAPGQHLIAHEVTHVAQSLRGERVAGAAKKIANTGYGQGEAEAEIAVAVDLTKITGGYLKGQLKAATGAAATVLSCDATVEQGPLKGVVDKIAVSYDVKTKALTGQFVLAVDKVSALLPRGVSATGQLHLDLKKDAHGISFSTGSTVDVKIESLLGGKLKDVHVGDGLGATFLPEGEFPIGAVRVVFAEGSRLTVDTHTGVTGALKGTVQIGTLPKLEVELTRAATGIAVHVATTIPLHAVHPKLDGQVKVAYDSLAPGRKLDFTAEHPRLTDLPAADILAGLHGATDGKELTGTLTARKGATVEHLAARATIEKGELALLPGRKLEGDLEGKMVSGIGEGHVQIGLHGGVFSWGAHGKVDLAVVTHHVLIGEIEAEAGSTADATFASKGVTFGAKALQGIKITGLRGNLSKGTFKISVDATSLAKKLEHQIPGVELAIAGATAELAYDGSIRIDAAIHGHATVRTKSHKELASGSFGLTLDANDFGGELQVDKFDVSQYLKGHGLVLDLRAGVKSGTVEFAMPGLAHGKIDGLVLDLKQRHFGFDAELDFDGTQQLIGGTKLHVALADGVLTGDAKFKNEYVSGAAALTTGRGGTVFHGHLDKKLTGLGKIGDNFLGAELTYAPDTGLAAKGGFTLSGLTSMLGADSKIELSYANHKLAVDGTLHAGHLEHVTYTGKNELKIHWTQGGRLKVLGHLDATIANLAEVSLKIAAGPGTMGAEGAGEADLDATAPRFFLSGRITGKGLQKFFPSVRFADPTASVHLENGADGKWTYAVDDLTGRITGIDGVDEADLGFTGSYAAGKGISTTATIKKLRVKQFELQGALGIKDNKVDQSELGMEAHFPGVKLAGHVTVARGELGHLSWKTHVVAEPSEHGPLSWVKSGSIDATMEKGKITEVKGALALQPPSFLPVENPNIEIKYDGEHIVGTLDAEFASPLHKSKKGTLKLTIGGPKKFEAEIHMPAKLPGMKEADVYGKVTADGHVEIGAVLDPDGLPFVKRARVAITYANGAFVVGGHLTLAPTDEYEVELGVEYDITNKQFRVLGLEPKHDDKAKDTPLLALQHDKHFTPIPLVGIGVLNIVLTMRASYGVNVNKPFFKFETPRLIGGLEALDEGRMPGIEFGGKVGMGAELFAEFGVGVAGQVELLIASAEMGIEGVLHAGLTMNLQADIHGKFEHGKGVDFTIDPSVSAALKLTASLNAFLHAEALWWTIVDKHWPLASMDIADIALGEFHPFDPFRISLGGPGGTAVHGLAIKDDQSTMTEGAKRAGAKASDDAANAETKEKVAPVLARIREVARRFERAPDWQGKGLTVPVVEFDSWYGIDSDKWDTYREVADNAEQLVPEQACKTPTEKLSKAVAILSKRNPVLAGMLVLQWERAQVAAQGFNPDTGEDVVAKQKEIEALAMTQYADALAAWQAAVAVQQTDHGQAVAKQAADLAVAEQQHAARSHETHAAFEQQTQRSERALQAQQATLAQGDAGPAAPMPARPRPTAPIAPKLQRPEPIKAPTPIAAPVAPAPVPAITLPALPADPGVSPPTAATVPKAKPARPVVAPPPSARPVPAAPSSQAAALGGKTATSRGGGGGGGAARPAMVVPRAAAGGGGTGAPGPAVVEGPPGIIGQDRALEARRAALGGAAGKGAAPSVSPAASAAPNAAANAATGPHSAPAKPVAAPDASVQQVAAAATIADQQQRHEAETRAAQYAQQTEQAQQAAEAAAAKATHVRAATPVPTTAPAAVGATASITAPVPAAHSATASIAAPAITAPTASATAPAKAEPPPVPKSLVEPRPAKLAHPTAAFSAELAHASSGAVLYEAGTNNPADVTRNLLATHPEAHLDTASGRLNLPPVPEDALGHVDSLAQLGRTLALATGVSKVTLEKTGDRFVIHGHINPETTLVTGDALPRTAAEFLDAYTVAVPKAVQVTRLGVNPHMGPAKVPMEGADPVPPGYVINMASTPGEVQPNIASKYADEAWAKTDKKDLAIARTGVVVGINGFARLDATADEKIKGDINKAVSGVSGPPSLTRIAFGFAWSPQWHHKAKGDVPIDDARTAFAALPKGEQATVSAERERPGLWAREGKLPYGIFREEVLGSAHTRAVVAHIAAIADPVHIVSQDADGQVAALAPGKGVLTAYDDFLRALPVHPLLTIGGYNFEGFQWSDQADPRSAQLTKLANAIDRAVRAAIATLYPDMLYPAEPNTLMKATDKVHGDGIFDLEAQRAKLQAALDARPDQPREGKFYGIGQNEGRTAMLSIRQEAGDDFDMKYAPEAGVTTSPVEGNAARGLEVTPDTLRSAAAGTLARDGETYDQDARKHPYTGVSTQAQSYADPRTLAREYRKTTPATKDEGARLREIMAPVESAGRALAGDPALTRDSAQIERELANVDRRLRLALEAKAYDDQIRAALTRAAEVAKAIIVAMTAADLKATWTQLQPLLDQIKVEAEQRKK